MTAAVLIFLLSHIIELFSQDAQLTGSRHTSTPSSSNNAYFVQPSPSLATKYDDIVYESRM